MTPADDKKPLIAKELPKRPSHNPLDSDDPSTAALRAWAKEKEMVLPGKDGTISMMAGYGLTNESGAAFQLPRNGSTLPPPDERWGRGMRHGTPELVKSAEPVIKHVEGEERERKDKKDEKDGRLSNFFRGLSTETGKEKDAKHGKDEHVIR
ncbi:hypothetical protein MMC06_005068 [Schaereria dolodes]|nr:hypothetical protein [Schaereria dolodes]